MFSKLTCLFVSYLESSKKNLFKSIASFIANRSLPETLSCIGAHLCHYTTVPHPSHSFYPPPLHLAMNMSKRVWSGRTYEYVPHSLELIRKCFLSNFHETHHLLFTKTWRKYEIFSIAKIEYSIYTNNFEYPFSFYEIFSPENRNYNFFVEIFLFQL